jgi:hypothetical protein
MRKLRSFRNDKRAIILPAVIAITFIILSSIIWLAGALIVNRTFDQLQGIIAECDPRVLSISQNALNAYAVSIVVVDGLLLVWWGLSSQKVESQESPAPYGGY